MAKKIKPGDVTAEPWDVPAGSFAGATINEAMRRIAEQVRNRKVPQPNVQVMTSSDFLRDPSKFLFRGSPVTVEFDTAEAAPQQEAVPARKIHEDVDKRIAELLDPPPSGGGEGKGQGKGQGGNGEGSEGSQANGDQKPQDGKPKPGEQWETEKGQKVDLLDAGFGDLAARPTPTSNTMFWSEDGTPFNGYSKQIAGKLVRKVSSEGEKPLPTAEDFVDAEEVTVEGQQEPSQGAGEAQGEQKPVKVSRKAGDRSKATGAVPPGAVKGVVTRDIVFTPGCHAVLRNGDTIGPFEPMTGSSGAEWTWQVDTGDDIEAYRSNGTYGVSEGKANPNDVVRIVTAEEAGRSS